MVVSRSPRETFSAFAPLGTVVAYDLMSGGPPLWVCACPFLNDARHREVTVTHDMKVEEP